ncbi:response regulator [Dysgonomonas sp. Marseille-P4677]|uniref:hybrid sensor histidine kinase/response regulator transcription factor n=1 Tax=Dysgonomonas sp. Marseille-P4677 TaxID=2364790 RepID=UPI001913C49C|nr:hybrid sensor histidine kinase/response regulator transcription factor [Dysgonomonas sp. Marseille-P4677]MBK5722061.1 response regulator [Dysgonomonas sp. Marseille-P4677]
MKKNRLCLVLSFFIFAVLASHGNQITVKPLPLIGQLPSNSVQRVYQDKEGFMWFGTLDGLCRYDAYRMLVFRSDLNNPELLSNNEITCFAEDNNNNLLIGTKRGLNILNKKTYQIKHFEGKEIFNSEIKCITVSSDGNIWIGTNSRVFRFDRNLSFCKIYEDNIPITSISSIYEDTERNLWITTWRCGLYKYDKTKDTFTKLPKVGTIDNPFKIFQDNKNQYWICTWGDGIYLFNPKQENEDIYTHTDIKINDKLLTEERFFSITQDDTYGYIWMISISGIYAKKYTSEGTIQDVDISHLFKETNNIYSEIIKDKSGNLWIGTFSEGVLTINFDIPALTNYPMLSIKEQTGITPNITVIYKDKDGDIWFNQNRWGLGIFNPTNNKIRFYHDFPSLKDLNIFNIVSCISEFRSIPNEIWIGPENEAEIYCVTKEKDNVVVSRRINLENLASNSGYPRFFFEDSRNNIWIITSTGLFIKQYNKEDIEPVSFSLGSITGITEDLNGTIWISSKSSGIYQIPLSNNSILNKSAIKTLNKKNDGLASDNIESICADINGKIWIGTKEGNIIAYDINSREQRDLSGSFKMKGEGILNIVADNYGHIWVSTNKRITEYNSESGALRSYSTTDGLLVNSFLINSYFKEKSGKILFGGNKGISVFTPTEKLSEKAKDVKTVITDIKINNQSVFQGNNNKRLDIISQTLIFEPDDKNIEIDFSSLDYTFPSKIQYAYKMEGIDDDWIYTENDRQFAIYNQLSKGSHTFYIKATDENRLWSSEITQLKIYKRPAFYETWWAYTIYLILLLGITYWAYRIIKNRINLRNELKIAQIEKDKSEELTQTKLRYFTNISHDFLTPLTIISCLIDDAEITYKNKIAQFDMMRSNVNRLRRLLQQVLDFRKVESGNMKLKIAQGDIATFIKDTCYTHFLPLMKKKNIELFFTTSSNQIQAYFDADKIDKIVFNLLSNAYKYTPKNGKVEIELKECTKQNIPYLMIKISDSGIGIAQEDLTHIFTRFYNNKINEGSDTNGIGLSLTKDLIDLHHGTIHAESEINIGTAFIIQIPIGKESYSISEICKSEMVVLSDEKEIAPILSIEAINETYLEINTSGKEKTTILLAEDNEELLTLISNILARDYNVLIARNGKEALTMIKDKDIDIIISDVMMPEIDGLELCRLLKKDLETSHIPVILLTAKNSADDRIECYNAGADGYISKPFDLKVLEARINNFISNKKDRQKEFKSDVEINISTLEYPSIDEQFLNNAIKIIEEHLSETEFDVNTFAEHLNMSKSSLYRKMKTMTGLSPIEFIRNIRLKHACQMLKDRSMPISEVAYSVGFSDPKYFTSCFKLEFNVTPSDFQRNSTI